MMALESYICTARILHGTMAGNPRQKIYTSLGISLSGQRLHLDFASDIH